MDLSVVIPAFNEADRIVSTLKSTSSFLEEQPWSYEILVVDDGSGDDTIGLAREFGAARTTVKCLRNEANRGKGFSIRHGVAHAVGDTIGFIDADDKTNIRALPSALRFLEEGYDGIVGDRTLPDSQIDAPRRQYRQWGSDAFKILMRSWTGLGDFPDTQCGFKFFRAPVMRDLFARQQTDGYMFDVEILILAQRAGYRIKRVPVTWRDDPDSRFRPISGSLRNLRELVRMSRRLR